MKRGMGRAATVNGNGRMVLPPPVVEPVRRYKAPEPPPRSTRSTVAKVFGWILLALVVVVTGLAGGLYLYGHESLNAIAPHTAAVKATQKDLAPLPTAAEPATALIVGYDARAGSEGFGLADSRSDTIMLVRADPQTNTLSLLSFPRDLQVPIYCDPVTAHQDRPDQLRLVDLPDEPPARDARHGSEADGAVGELFDHAQLPRLQAAREQAPRRLPAGRSPLHQHRQRAERLRHDQSQAGLPEARRAAGARLRPLPPHRLRCLPARPPAALPRGAQGPAGHESVSQEPPRRDRRAQEQRRDGPGRRRAGPRASRRSSRTPVSPIDWAAGTSSASRFRTSSTAASKTHRSARSRPTSRQPWRRSPIPT